MAPAFLLLALAFCEPARDTTFIVPEGARIAIALREGDVHVPVWMAARRGFFWMAKRPGSGSPPGAG